MSKLGVHWTFNLNEDPKRLSYVLSRYRSANRIAGRGKVVCEVGCSEGIGAALLIENYEQYHGIDLDIEAIEAARSNFSGKAKFGFEVRDIVQSPLSWRADTVVSLDVIEHIDPHLEDEFAESLRSLCKQDGMLILGTPNLSAAEYQSHASAIGHVNLFDHHRLSALIERNFKRSFVLGMNDESLHTGQLEQAHYLLAVGIFPREPHQ
jgi:2-polyprenyl-3-methyl-5-hydroxy-6-metoxy-1,4-benzoquinol methylase